MLNVAQQLERVLSGDVEPKLVLDIEVEGRDQKATDLSVGAGVAIDSCIALKLGKPPVEVDKIPQYSTRPWTKCAGRPSDEYGLVVTKQSALPVNNTGWCSIPKLVVGRMVPSCISEVSVGAVCHGRKKNLPTK